MCVCASKIQEDVGSESELQGCRQELRDGVVGLQAGCKVKKSQKGAKEKGSVHMGQ